MKITELAIYKKMFGGGNSGGETEGLTVGKLIDTNIFGEVTAKDLEGVTMIKRYAFCDCEYMTGIEIPDSVWHIGERVFDECWYLNTLDIPASVTTIVHHAFANCMGLKEITFHTNPADIFIGENIFEGLYETPTIRVLAEFVDGYKAMPNLAQYADHIVGY